MKISDEIIKILDYLCSKIGITIDWTSDNVLPYIEQLFEKFIKWEIGTSIGWIAICVVSTIIISIILKIFTVEDYGFVNLLIIIMVIISLITISVQLIDIITCYTFPEKVIYDFIVSKTSTNH